MKRILIATTIPQTINRFVQPQLATFIQSGWDVHLAASGAEWSEEVLASGATTHEIDMKRQVTPAHDSRALVRWIKLLRHLRPNVVIAGTPKAALLGMVAARVCGTPVRIYHCRGSRWENSTGIQKGILINSDRITARSSTSVLAVSPSLAELVLKNRVTRSLPDVLGRGGSKGVDLKEFAPGPPGLRPTGPLCIGFLGRLSGDKGIDTVLKVFEVVQQSHPDIRLRVAGGVDDSSPAAPQTLDRLQRDEQIEWLGQIANVPSFLRGIDVLIFPSAREGLPNAVIEAAACGIPTVGWNVTGVRDAIAFGETGYFASYGDEAALAGYALKVLEQPRSYFRDACREWAHGFDSKLLAKLTMDYVEREWSESGAQAIGRTS